jgi:hypothetical protein
MQPPIQSVPCALTQAVKRPAPKADVCLPLAESLRIGGVKSTLFYVSLWFGAYFNRGTIAPLWFYLHLAQPKNQFSNILSILSGLY